IPAKYQLDIILKKGNNLAIRDRTGTSDPYVKFKLGGKEVFKSKTIYKNLNPVWDESFSLQVETLKEPLYIKVFDQDFGVKDDFMGSTCLHLESLELQRTLDLMLELKDPKQPEHNLGYLSFVVTLSPKEEDIEGAYQSMRLSDVDRKAQMWRGIVSIGLIEGRNLQPMDANDLSDPYVKFKMGQQKYNSKAMPKTLNPQWREQFDFHFNEEHGEYVEITVWDKDVRTKDDFMGRCTIDLSLLSKEETHKLELPLEEGEGMLVLMVTLTASTSSGSNSDLPINKLDDPQERHQIMQRYSLWRSLHNRKDVGVVQVKVIQAKGLMAADVRGKSDPFCVVELRNDQRQTHTVYKNLNPEWNKVFTFDVKDIHSVLEVTVYDKDRNRSADFLGKVAIPLLNIQNGERIAYALKNKKLTRPRKGVIFLEIDVIFNAVKGIPTFSKELLSRNINRVRRCVTGFINTGRYINSYFDWESPQRSICAFLLFVIIVWNFDIYMIPMALLSALAWNYIIRQDMQTMEDLVEDEDEEFDNNDKDSEKKGPLKKLHALQDVVMSVQNALDKVASYGERIKNTFNWTVPFLTWLVIGACVVATIIVYFIPLRYIVLAWGVNKFTKKLRNRSVTTNNNKLLNFLSRVPSDVQVDEKTTLGRPPPEL
uniref:Multiple C2 and transmembrane domain containing 1 n=1 Tax=Neogobius melanostomus TaxID=47308 RepID=A0A8C6UDL2_9GOBI